MMIFRFVLYTDRYLIFMDTSIYNIFGYVDVVGGGSGGGGARVRHQAF